MTKKQQKSDHCRVANGRKNSCIPYQMDFILVSLNGRKKNFQIIAVC